MKKLAVAALAALMLVGCAAPSGANYVPLIDTKQTPQYEDDLRECQNYAARAAGAGDTAVAGAMAGALLGLAVGAILGGGGHGRLAGLGALTGAVQGGAAGETNQRDVIRRCMAGRGYSVLG